MGKGIGLNNVIGLGIVIYFGLTSCVRQQSFGFKPREDVLFPNTVGPVYFVDTIHIKEPRYVRVSFDSRKGGGVDYIVPKMYLDSIEKETIGNSRYSIRVLNNSVQYSSDDLAFDTFDYSSLKKDVGFNYLMDNNQCHYKSERAELILEQEVQGMKVYKFRAAPFAFLISLASETEPLTSDVVGFLEYSNVYIPCATPLYQLDQLKYLQGIDD